MAHKDSSGKKEKMFILEVAPVYLPKMYADRPVCQNNDGVQELTGAEIARVQGLQHGAAVNQERGRMRHFRIEIDHHSKKMMALQPPSQ